MKKTGCGTILYLAVFAVIVVGLLLLPPQAEASTYNGLNYTVENGEVTIIGCMSTLTGAVEIPSEIEGYPVKYIRESAFARRTGITSVVLSDSVIHIGQSAFEDCTSLTSVTLGSGITTIEQWTFNSCGSLTTIVIPDSVTSIGAYAFNSCTRLNYNVYDNAMYLGNATNPYLVLIKAKDTNITSCDIHSDTKIIYTNAFYGCGRLTSVSVPNGLVEIGSNVFTNCTNLNFNVYDNGNYLGNVNNPYVALVESTDIFETSCTIHPSTKFICSNAFTSSSVTSIAIPDSVISIGISAFESCIEMTSLTIGNSVTTIENSAFNNCYSLTNLVIPDSVTKVGVRAFENCSGLEEVVLGNGLKDMTGFNFKSNGNLQSVVIGNSITSVGYCAFQHCINLTQVHFGNSVSTIDRYAFSGCISLKEISLPESLTTIGNNAFETCGLISVTIPDSVTSLGGSAFAYCSEMTDLTIGSGIADIGEAAFEYCERLTSVTIPDSVTVLRDGAFNYCTGLQKIYFGETVPQIGQSFSQVVATAYYPVYVPEWTEDVRQNYGGTLTWQPYGVKSLSVHTLPDKLSYFGKKDALDLTGGKLLMITAKDKQVVLDMTEEMVSGFNNTVLGTQTLTVALGDQTTSFDIQITGAQIVFYDADGTVLQSGIYLYGDPVLAPAAPSKAPDHTYTYEFAGWDKTVVNCVADASYAATYTPVYIDYTVTFQHADGTVIAMGTYHYNDPVTAPQTPEAPEKGYEFIGWDKQITNCTGDAVYTAVFERAYIPGDINMDGVVTRDDVVRLLLHVTSPFAFTIDVPADFTGDGQVTRADVVKLLLYVTNAQMFPL